MYQPDEVKMPKEYGKSNQPGIRQKSHLPEKTVPNLLRIESSPEPERICRDFVCFVAIKVGWKSRKAVKSADQKNGLDLQYSLDIKCDR
mgnify:CR=1 FL=1